MCKIPVKESVRYLGIHISISMWLQRDLSLLGRVLLSKADGISRFLYPTLSLFVQESLCKEINNILILFRKTKPII